jgi:hypothetical protein
VTLVGLAGIRYCRPLLPLLTFSRLLSASRDRGNIDGNETVCLTALPPVGSLLLTLGAI